MTPSIKDLGIDRLVVEERLALVEEVWDSIPPDQNGALPTEPQRRELERRLAASLAAPDDVVPWEEVLAKALARARQ
ncbi:MAG TPA: addiction module protein [Gemmataceae bacterium]|nr:addiction module protein [Gemmataceae bacterium]